MQDSSFKLIFPAQDGSPLGAQRRQRERYEAVSRAWAERRREYLRRLGLRTRLGGQPAAPTSRWAAS